jgi:hypothetical protein
VLGLRIVAQRLSRRMEKRADAVAHEHVGGAIYASALERLSELNLAPAVLWGKGGTHPFLADRMRAAGVEPDWPRPDPPSRGRLYAGVLTALAVSLLCQVPQLSSVYAWIDDLEQRAHWSIALTGGRPTDLYLLGATSPDLAQRESALSALRLATTMSPESHEFHAKLAELLASSDRCAEASRELTLALEWVSVEHVARCRVIDLAYEAHSTFCDPEEEPLEEEP